jgi:hypothetical protein
MKGLLSKLRRRMARDYPRRTVFWDEEGFTVTEEDKAPSRLEWVEIDKIYAHKIDLFSYDEIMLGFAAQKANRVVEVGESLTGFQEFRSEVERRYPTALQDWFTTVAFPAFEQNLTTIWERA